MLAKRYNNPGDLSWPIHGYDGPGEAVQVHNDQGSHYASFPTVQDGVRALHCRLVSYIERGYDTIRKMNHVYAADPHWHSHVSQFSHIPADEKLDPESQRQIVALTFGVVQAETGCAAFFGLHPYPTEYPTIEDFEHVV